MSLLIKHAKVSTIPDGADPNLVLPSDWNNDHTFTGVLDIANGGTGSTTANTAINALLPNQTGNSGKVLSTNGTDTSWIASGTGSGDVTGPASSTDNAITRFNGTTGKVVQNSSVIIDDSNNVSGVATLNAATLIIADNTTLGSSNADTIAVNGRITTDLEPNTTGSRDIGTNGRNWRDAFFSRNVQVGTITSGVWNGSTIGVAYGGTGATTLTGILVGNGTSAFTTTTAPSGTIVGTTDTQTLTNKRINPRVVAASGTSGSLTIDGDITDVYKAEALTGAITLLTPSGTPADGQKLMIRLEDNGTGRGITWTTSAGAFRAVGITLPTTTVASKVSYVGCAYNSTDGFWDVVATVTQA
jgi:hypothetical protein